MALVNRRYAMAYALVHDHRGLKPTATIKPRSARGTAGYCAFEICRGATRGHRMANLRVILR